MHRLIWHKIIFQNKHSIAATLKLLYCPENANQSHFFVYLTKPYMIVGPSPWRYSFFRPLWIFLHIPRLQKGPLSFPIAGGRYTTGEHLADVCCNYLHWKQMYLATLLLCASTHSSGNNVNLFSNKLESANNIHFSRNTIQTNKHTTLSEINIDWAQKNPKSSSVLILTRNSLSKWARMECS